MDFIRRCHVYQSTQCNCPEGTCRRQQAEDDAKLELLKTQLEKTNKILDLVNFQTYLLNKGLIKNKDWSFEQEATSYINKTNLKHETNKRRSGTISKETTETD